MDLQCDIATIETASRLVAGMLRTTFARVAPFSPAVCTPSRREGGFCGRG